MDFRTLTKFSTLLSRSFAGDFLRLLVMYESLSASEAASRLNQHIKTAQDFLDGLTYFGFVNKVEVYEGKRPYYRYNINNTQINIQFDISSLYDLSEDENKLYYKIRERRNSGVAFTSSSNLDAINTITIFQGKGRAQKERKLSLTKIQGRFLFHLPFPTADFMSIADIIEKAGLNNKNSAEIVDLVEVLETYKVIELAE